MSFLKHISKVLVVAAHPDDETIGAGALLRGISSNVRIIHMTDGAPRNGLDATALGFATVAAYARRRRSELERAVGEAGIRPRQLTHFGIPDQELTHCLPEAIQKLRTLIEEFAPAVILTHPYEGGHPDHDSTALAVFIATALVAQTCQRPPMVVEFTSYHAKIANAASKHREMETATFLPVTTSPEFTLTLSTEEQVQKCLMFAHFETQREVLKNFQVSVEKFRRAPSYDFTQAPHPGPLFYENHPRAWTWGMTGKKWRQKAAEVLPCL
ncbi:MAG: hypothetical protein A2Z97_15600 [Bdellovibrionales bacterium GWB1_52_6]|nr:MAG: hypothetical protein A2Z97_15600 [Bdellovibrionales bacterium GWB1_52_6]OFZ02915.1 MAG: hypothetical protein A2X97_04905 [Bdellovibrionales bacterium GWA1_52_35]